MRKSREKKDVILAAVSTKFIEIQIIKKKATIIFSNDQSKSSQPIPNQNRQILLTATNPKHRNTPIVPIPTSFHTSNK